MELTSAHLRYLLTIYEASLEKPQVSSRTIAERLGVTKPSVVRILNVLMEKKMLVKEHYGKIYLTDRGIFTAKKLKACMERIRENFPLPELELSDEEVYSCSLVLASSLPERLFSGRYEEITREDNV